MHEIFPKAVRRGAGLRERAHGIVKVPVGHAGTALLIDNQPVNPFSAIELLNPTEAAEFLAISISGMRRLQHGRHIPFFKVGGGIRFAKSDLMSYLARQRVGLIGQ